LKDVFTFHFQKHQQEKGTGYAFVRGVFQRIKYLETIIFYGKYVSNIFEITMITLKKSFPSSYG